MFRLILGLAVALTVAGCDLLEVTDPDIVNPEVIGTPEGAEALRIGALRQLNVATGGVEVEEANSSFIESMFMLSGLMADEFRSGDTFIQRDETDRRGVQNQNANVDDAYRTLHRARITARQAEAALESFAPDEPVWKRAQMFFAQGYVETALGEYFCGAVPFSDIAGSEVVFGDPLTTTQIFERAVGHFDEALTLLGAPDPADDEDTEKTRWAAQVGKGRALLNLARYTEAAAAVAGVPTEFQWLVEASETPINNTIWEYNNNERRFTMGDLEGGNGLNFFSANDPRLPRCVGGDATCRANGVTNSRVFDSSVGTTLPFYVQLKWPENSADVAIVDGIEARLIEAEALLQGSPSGGLTKLNELRATVPGLAPLTAATTQAEGVDQLFRERAFWMFGTGHRLGDLRRLVRQYGRGAETVFPTGNFLKGGTFGAQVNFPVPQSEENNPQFQRSACVATDA
jgi:hypothetical protein